MMKSTLGSHETLLYMFVNALDKAYKAILPEPVVMHKHIASSVLTPFLTSPQANYVS